VNSITRYELVARSLAPLPGLDQFDLQIGAKPGVLNSQTPEGCLPGASESLTVKPRVVLASPQFRMKKTPRAQRPDVDDVRPEYQFDYSQAKPNRFASRLKRPVVAVILESDVAPVFDSSAKVNAQLRSAISARKHRKPVTRARTHHRRAG
jgi:hypothetical protein